MIVSLADPLPYTLAWLGWSALDAPLLVLLPLLVICSGFFSGAETAFFSLSAHDRMEFRQRHSIGSRAVLTLYADQRMLLITILLGNMTVNVVYFVVSSVLMMRTTAGAIVEVALLLASLMLLVLFGEVLPKMIASTKRMPMASLIAPPMLALHRAIGPLRIVLSRLVIGPLAKLTEPPERPARLTRRELEALLDVSSEQGIIDDEEQSILGEVFNFRRLKIRDIMQPRVRMLAVPRDVSRDDVIAATRESRLTRLPVYDGDLDHIIGMLHVKRYLLGDDDLVTSPAVMTRPLFVPQMATLEQLLEQCRTRKAKSAIVIDEFGGTAGIVTMTDIAEELVGEITGDVGPTAELPRLIGEGRWQVSGQFAIHDWIDTFGHKQIPSRISTLGGLIAQQLGRAPRAGDVVDLGNMHLEVEAVEGHLVVSAIVSLLMPTDENGADA